MTRKSYFFSTYHLDDASEKFRKIDQFNFRKKNYEEVRDELAHVSYRVDKNRRYERNVMHCVGSSMLAGQVDVCGWFVDPETKKLSPLPRPYAQNLRTRHWKRNPTKYKYFHRFVEQAEIFVLKHLLEVRNFKNNKERRELLHKILQIKKKVPKSVRVCNSIFTQMVIIGDGTPDRDISLHKDNGDLITCIITFGDISSGGSTQYFDNEGLLMMNIPFLHGRVQVGCFDEVNHMVPEWKGERTTFNFNIKKKVIDHFLKFGPDMYNQFEKSGFLNGFVAHCNTLGTRR